MKILTFLIPLITPPAHSNELLSVELSKQGSFNAFTHLPPMLCCHTEDNQKAFDRDESFIFCAYNLIVILP